MQLDPKGQEAASIATNTIPMTAAYCMVMDGIRAYLSAAPSPSPAPGVVEALVSLLTLTKFELDGNIRPPWTHVIAKADTALASISQPAQSSAPKAFLVCNFHVARQPVKAKGKFEPPTQYLYPADREKDAREAAKIMRGDFIPLYASPLSGDGQ